MRYFYATFAILLAIPPAILRKYKRGYRAYRAYRAARAAAAAANELLDIYDDTEIGICKPLITPRPVPLPPISLPLDDIADYPEDDPDMLPGSGSNHQPRFERCVKECAERNGCLY